MNSTRTISLTIQELSFIQSRTFGSSVSARWPSVNAASHHLGPHGRDDPRPRRGTAAGGDERGDDPGPRALHRAARRLRQQGRRARRGDGVRGAGRADVPPGCVELADRGDHARPRARLSRAGRAGRGAVLEGRGRRAAVRAGAGDRPGDARARGAGRRRGARAAAHRLPPRPARRAEPAHVPPRAGGGDRRRAVGPDGRRRALPRRDRRLAGLRADAVRRPRARALGARALRAAARVARPRRAVDLVGRRHRAPPAGCGRSARGRRAAARPGGRRGARAGGGGGERALRLALPRERRARACSSRGAARVSGHRSGSSG